MDRIICIELTYLFPPIPIRDFDWVAYEQDKEEDRKYGYGETQESAINELFEVIE